MVSWGEWGRHKARRERARERGDNVGPGLAKVGALQRLARKLIGSPPPPIDEGYLQLCEVRGPGMKGGEPGS